MKRQCWKCNIKNVPLYPRAKRGAGYTVAMCANCCDLDLGETGMVYFRDGYQRDGNPRSQPNKASIAREKLPCVYCKIATLNRYSWNSELIPACGWGHAGLWMDVQIDTEQGLDMDYVFKSLGVDSPGTSQ